MQAAEEMQAALQEKEVVLTEEEIKVIHGFLAKVKNGEISRAQLKQRHTAYSLPGQSPKKFFQKNIIPSGHTKK